MPSRLRTCTTRLTLRLPVRASIPDSRAADACSLLTLRRVRSAHARLQQHFAAAVERLEGVLRGHRRRLARRGPYGHPPDRHGPGHGSVSGPAPAGGECPPSCRTCRWPEQVLGPTAQRVPGGWTFGPRSARRWRPRCSSCTAPRRRPTLACSRRRVPRRAPAPGPVGRLARTTHPRGQHRRRGSGHARAPGCARSAPWRFCNASMLGDASPEHVALKEELDSLLRQFFLTRRASSCGAACMWCVWGAAPDAGRGACEDVVRAGRRLDLEFLPEPDAGRHAVSPDPAAGL